MFQITGSQQQSAKHLKKLVSVETLLSLHIFKLKTFSKACRDNQGEYENSMQEVVPGGIENQSNEFWKV